MKKLLLATVALTAMVAAPAMAADLSVRQPMYKAPPPPPVSYYSWTGCYIGGHGGGLWARKDWSYVTPAVGAAGSHDADSWLAGLQAGCNFQVGGFVFGVQGDYAWTDAKGSHNDIAFPGFVDQSNIRSLASVTGRVGYAWDRFLGYVKGGGAWERDNYTFFVGGVTFATASETRGGWTLGIGGEYAFLPNLTGFIEYDYYDFGTRSLTFTDGSIVDIKERKSVLKAGLNIKFGWGGGPVMAAY
jgi:outer membrane immunogenic protein